MAPGTLKTNLRTPTGRGQGFGGDEDFAGEHALHEVAG